MSLLILIFICGTVSVGVGFEYNNNDKHHTTNDDKHHVTQTRIMDDIDDIKYDVTSTLTMINISDGHFQFTEDKDHEDVVKRSKRSTHRYRHHHPKPRMSIARHSLSFSRHWRHIMPRVPRQSSTTTPSRKNSAQFGLNRRISRGFCHLLCGLCEGLASRRWSMMCGTQCESGGLAFNVCLDVWRKLDRQVTS